ncbi:hypothetical protein CRUP_014639 [Coryphaenoides rupestris]|nr:hypothetical protein CRUP_014639 [Coryphaenoides rupestris]
MQYVMMLLLRLWIIILLLLLPDTTASTSYSSTSLPAERRRRSRPNVVLMMVDDLGIGDLGCYGNTTISTPNIDRLAQQGVRLTQHLAAAPLCTPSRAAFLTGRSSEPGAHAGDHCHHPSRHGFDRFYGLPLTNLRDCGAGHGSVYSQVGAYVHGLAAAAAAGALLHLLGTAPLPVGRRAVLALVLAAAAAEILYAAFLAAVATLNCVLMRDQQVVEQPYVHTALFASPAFQGTSRHGIYGDAIHEVDWSVGQIVKTLDRLNLRSDTLVYLTSDQGAHLEEISASGQVHRGSNGIYKSGKSTNWEGGIRVPGIVSMPGTIPGGGVQDQPTSNMDLFPTVVTLAGGHLPHDRWTAPDTSSSSTTATRTSTPSASAVWKAFYFTPDFTPGGGDACFHTRVCFCTPAFVTRHDPPLLYDLSRDPSEAAALTPATEPAFHAVLAAMEEAVGRHRRSLEPPGPGAGHHQLSLGNILWKPWLQPCCSSLGRLCACRRDDRLLAEPPPAGGALGVV